MKEKTVAAFRVFSADYEIKLCVPFHCFTLRSGLFHKFCIAFLYFYIYIIFTYTVLNLS